MKTPEQWDLDYDVVVAGYGYAGAMTAITAHDLGARVVILEKMPHFGGNSILSGGACAVAFDEEGALQYMRRTSGDRVDDEVVQAYARGLVEMPEILRQLAEPVGFDVVVDRYGATYPFPGGEKMGAMRITRTESYRGFPWAKGLKAGGTLFWVVAEQVQRRGIAVRYNTPVRELVTDEEGAVVGVLAEESGAVGATSRSPLQVRARRAVVLCTGGFEHNQELRDDYLQIQHTISMSPVGNTGDGILMAQKVGAALWHMWHLHGGYGFKIPGLPVAVRHSWAGFRNDRRPMPWIAVDRFGRRFMDEYPPAPQDTVIRALEYFDPDIQDYPRIPCYLVFDDVGRRLGPIGEPKINDEKIDFQWSEDNLREVAAGHIRRADSLAELAAQLGIEAEVFVETVERWNAHCRAGRDRDFRRPPGTMVPIAEPPYYAIEGWPIITNTQGGPVHNARQQVVDPYGKPIPRLYAAGELGSLFGHLYLLAGNNSECFISGRIAGRHAATEQSWVAEPARVRAERRP